MPEAGRCRVVAWIPPATLAKYLEASRLLRCARSALYRRAILAHTGEILAEARRVAAEREVREAERAREAAEAAENPQQPGKAARRRVIPVGEKASVPDRLRGYLAALRVSQPGLPPETVELMMRTQAVVLGVTSADVPALVAEIIGVPGKKRRGRPRKLPEPEAPVSVPAISARAPVSPAVPAPPAGGGAAPAAGGTAASDTGPRESGTGGPGVPPESDVPDDFD